jgi:hypothetical protein
MLKASCLCGAVTWEFEGPLQFMSHCHCSRCRKTHGAAFATYVAGPEDGCRVHGGEHVVRWQSSPGFFRCFCGRCGSVVPGAAADRLMFLPAGNFADDPGVRPMAHIFVAAKAPWYEIRDALSQFEAYPPGVHAPVIADRAPVDSPGAARRGSCLCGEVAFVVTGEPLRCYHCHCSRCRRARSAAHASNLFTTADGVRFTRGEDRLVAYKLPEAERFTQVFCRTCGSLLPRRARDRNIAVIPMGALDDDPGMRPQSHIFVASKAPWFDIADELPQYAEYPPS